MLSVSVHEVEGMLPNSPTEPFNVMTADTND